MKYKHVPLTDELFKKLKEEQKASGLTGNSIIILALNDYLKKMEKERK